MIALSMAVAAAASTPICTDRPTKANAVCTVPAGRIQVESGLAGWSLARTGGARAEAFTFGATFLKLGLSNRSDIQLGVTPLIRLKSRDGALRNGSTGFGDIQLRYKHRLTAEGAAVQVAAIPFAKLPTASAGFGNGMVEGGLAIPISFAGAVTVTLGPELDLLADVDGRGRHLAVVNLVTVAAPIGPKQTAVGELWSNFNFDPAGTVSQASADGALAYTVTETLQLDAGANLGLTRATPDIELYAGVSLRF